MGQYPELYLDELRDWIEFLTGELYSIPTLSRCMRKIGLSIKKVCFFWHVFPVSYFTRFGKSSCWNGRRNNDS